MATPSKQPKLSYEVDLIKEETLFDHLPDEVQLKIFKFLGIEDIIHCAQVSKRTRRICDDESIWEKINLYKKVVPSKFIYQILQKGCKYINLEGSKIVGDLKLSRKDYNVKYLNLHRCNAVLLTHSMAMDQPSSLGMMHHQRKVKSHSSVDHVLHSPSSCSCDSSS